MRFKLKQFLLTSASLLALQTAVAQAGFDRQGSDRAACDISAGLKLFGLGQARTVV